MKLDDNHKKTPFRIPDQYFEEFPDRLGKRIREESGKGGGKLVSLPAFIKMGIAASFLVLITFGIFHLTSGDRSADQMLAKIPTESLLAYLEESEMSFDELMETVDAELIVPDGNLMESGLISDEEIENELIEDIITDYELEFEI